MERSHRTDDEEFSLPCVLLLDTVEAFWGAGLGWLYDYNDGRVHLSYGLAGWTQDGCGVALGFADSWYVGLVSVVLLDEIVLDWLRAGLPNVNDVLVHYTTEGVRAYPSWHSILPQDEPHTKITPIPVRRRQTPFVCICLPQRRSNHPKPTAPTIHYTAAFICEQIRRSSAARRNGASNGVWNPTPVPSTLTTGVGNGASGGLWAMPCAAS